MTTCWSKTIVCLVSLVAIWGSGRPASADLNTSIQPSIEWLVDSCDAIYKARIGPMRGIEDRNFVTHWEPYKVTIAPGPQSGFVPLAQLAKEETWLIFFRWGPGGWHFVRAINVENPVAWSQTSAITAKGEVLRDRESIEKFVTERVNRKQQLPKGANPAELESLLRLHRARRADPAHDFPANAQQRLGGYLRYQTIEYWNSAIPSEEDIEEGDMLVIGIIVPADPANRDFLVQKLKSQIEDDASQHRWNEVHNDLWALVNYRDAEVTELLDRYVQFDHENRSKRGSVGKIAQTAWSIRHYWRYLDSLADPANQALAGRWEFPLQPTDVKPSPVYPRFWMDVLVTSDHRYTAICYRIRRPGDAAEVCRQSSGYWLAEGGKFGL